MNKKIFHRNEKQLIKHLEYIAKVKFFNPKNVKILVTMSGIKISKIYKTEIKPMYYGRDNNMLDINYLRDMLLNIKMIGWLKSYNILCIEVLT